MKKETVKEINQIISKNDLNLYETIEILANVFISQGSTYLDFDSSPSNKIDLLKFLKLVFFVSAARGKESYLIKEGVFNNFYALPLGPVESNVYEKIKKGDFITFSNNKLNIVNPALHNIDNYSDDNNLKKEFNELISINPKLIKLCSYDLVDLSHKWNSWETAFNIAKENGKKSHKMSNIQIMNDLKYYYL